MAVRLSGSVLKGLQQYAAKCGVTLAVLLCTLYTCLLSFWSDHHGREQGTGVISLGVPVANRPAGFESLVGCCMNMTVLRCELRRGQLFAELLLELQRKLAGAIDFSYPFSELVSRLQPPRIPGCVRSSRTLCV